jgi:hypothetical protein
MALAPRGHLVLGVLTCAAMLAGSASAQTGPFCGGAVTEKCLVSVTSTNPSTPASLSASLSFASSSGAYTITVYNTANANPFELSPALSTSSDVTIVFKLASDRTVVDPKMAISTALVSSWSINTAVSPHQLTLVAKPRATSWATSCSPSSCPNNATTDFGALLLAAFNPMNAPPSPPPGFSDFSAKMQGGFIATNAQYFDAIPAYDSTTKTLNFLIGAPHLKLNGDPNSGFVRLLVPEAVITDLWGISGGSAALVSNSALSTVKVGGSSASFSIDKVSTGALIKIGEVSAFGFSVPKVEVSPASTGSGSGTGATGPQPTITSIADQSFTVGGSATVAFTYTADVVAYFHVWATSSDETLIGPAQLPVSCDSAGACSLTITGVSGRTGTATITVTVSGRSQSATSSFGVTINAATPPVVVTPPVVTPPVVTPPVATPPVVTPTVSTTPRAPAASQSGSGVVLSWSAPDGGVPERYVIAGGATSGGNGLPVVVTPDASTAYTFPFVPSGTYSFRVFSVIGGALSAASPDAAVTVSNGPMPGFVTGVQATVSGRDVTLTWEPPIRGSTDPYFQVEFGTRPGARDYTVVTSVARTYTTSMPSGTYWMRVRAVSGGFVGPVSNDVSVVVAPAPCTAAPGAPVLLPVTTVAGKVTFSWGPGSGSAADRYRIEAQGGIALTTPGPGTSFLLLQSGGSFSAHVVGLNACGTSPPSSDVAFSIQP